MGYGGLSQLVLGEQYFSSTSPYNYFRATPTYNLPSHISVGQLSNIITVNKLTVGKPITLKPSEATLHQLNQESVKSLTKTNGLIDIEIDAL